MTSSIEISKENLIKLCNFTISEITTITKEYRLKFLNEKIEELNNKIKPSFFNKNPKKWTINSYFDYFIIARNRHISIDDSFEISIIRREYELKDEIYEKTLKVAKNC